jgi:hypothetical protein
MPRRFSGRVLTLPVIKEKPKDVYNIRFTEKYVGVITAVAVGLTNALLTRVIKSDPFSNCGYCQHDRTEHWKPGNTCPCSFWKSVTATNSSDITLYMKTPGG